MELDGKKYVIISVKLELKINFKKILKAYKKIPVIDRFKKNGISPILLIDHDMIELQSNYAPKKDVKGCIFRIFCIILVTRVATHFHTFL